MFKWDNQRRQKLHNKKEKNELERLEECTFKPEISRNSKLIIQHKKSTSIVDPVVNRLYHRKLPQKSKSVACDLNQLRDNSNDRTHSVENIEHVKYLKKNLALSFIENQKEQNKSIIINNINNIHVNLPFQKMNELKPGSKKGIKDN